MFENTPVGFAFRHAISAKKLKIKGL